MKIVDPEQIRHTIYIPSRGRSDTCLTAAVLLEDDVDFLVVVEPQEKESYVDQFGETRCLVMDDNDRGIAYVRNWIKDYSKGKGEPFHWQIDDNIKGFQIRQGNRNERIGPSRCLSLVETNVEQFSNIAAAGITHAAFAFSASQPVDINKQVYSCALFNNELDTRWRDGVVEDTDYSMQVLHEGWCTLLFNALLMEKATTMKMKGGNTELVYGGRGRELRSKGLIAAWPGAFKMTHQYGRPKILPSTVWRKFPQRPIPKEVTQP
jgi:hypothetical protein